MKRTVLLPALSIVAVAAVAISGCDSSATTSPQAGASESPSGAPASVASSPTPAKATTAAGDGCPVGAATLIAARKRNPELDKAILKTRSLSGIACYRGYAVAVSRPVETRADKAVLVFKYSGGGWSAVNGGTAGVCDGVVPADVRKKLELCR